MKVKNAWKAVSYQQRLLPFLLLVLLAGCEQTAEKPLEIALPIQSSDADFGASGMPTPAVSDDAVVMHNGTLTETEASEPVNPFVTVSEVNNASMDIIDDDDFVAVSLQNDAGEPVIVSLSAKSAAPVQEAAAESPNPRNKPPVYQGGAGDRNVQAGVSVWPIRPVFKDPEGRALRYSALNLPEGLSINAYTGEISGTPVEAGVYAGLRVLARDPSGGAALSLPTFTITVTDKLPSQCAEEDQNCLVVDAGGDETPLPTEQVADYQIDQDMQGMSSNGYTLLSAANTFRQVDEADVEGQRYHCNDGEVCFYSDAAFGGDVLVIDMDKLKGRVHRLALPDTGTWKSAVNNSNLALKLDYENLDVQDYLFSASSVVFDNGNLHRQVHSFTIASRAALQPIAENVSACPEGKVCLWSGPEFTGENIVIDPEDPALNRQWVYLNSYDYPDSPSYDFWNKVESIENLSQFDIQFTVGEGKIERELNARQSFDLTGTGCERDVRGLYIKRVLLN